MKINDIIKNINSIDKTDDNKPFEYWEIPIENLYRNIFDFRIFYKFNYLELKNRINFYYIKKYEINDDEIKDIPGIVGYFLDDELICISITYKIEKKIVKYYNPEEIDIHYYNKNKFYWKNKKIYYKIKKIFNDIDNKNINESEIKFINSPSDKKEIDVLIECPDKNLKIDVIYEVY